MNKMCLVYRHIAEKVLIDRKHRFVGREIAKSLVISPNTVSVAIAPLARSGAVEIHLRHFELINLDKMLAYWAVNRKLEKDIVYETYVVARNTDEIERKLPNEVAYTCCSGYKSTFGNDVSDYGSVYVYAGGDSLNEIKKRFPENDLSEMSKGHNLFVIKPDQFLEMQIDRNQLEHSSVSIPQLYVDLWNTKEWYSYEFLKRLKKRIDDMYVKVVLE